MNDTEILKKIGFDEAGKWTLHEKVKSGINFLLNNKKFENERVVYAFVVDDDVKYVGVCEKNNTTLKERLTRYKYRQGGSRSTNKRVGEKIMECLNNGKDVKIFALKPEISIKINDLEIDLVKGLENPLIEKFDPEWNKLKLVK
jgi:hypothetical protein